MSDFLTHIHRKFKKYKTSDLNVGLQVKTVGYLKNNVGSYSIVYRPKKFKIIGKSSEKLKHRFFSKNFDKVNTPYGKIPDYRKIPTFITTAKYYKAPTHNKQKILPSQTRSFLKHNLRIDNKSYDIILEDSITPLEEALEDTFKLPKKLNLKQVIDLEHFINNEELEMK